MLFTLVVNKSEANKMDDEAKIIEEHNELSN